VALATVNSQIVSSSSAFSGTTLHPSGTASVGWSQVVAAAASSSSVPGITLHFSVPLPGQFPWFPLFGGMMAVEQLLGEQLIVDQTPAVQMGCSPNSE
jgi:hypothetical protein